MTSNCQSGALAELLQKQLNHLRALIQHACNIFTIQNNIGSSYIMQNAINDTMTAVNRKEFNAYDLQILGDVLDALLPITIKT